ncbi:tripartite motif-containing protein 29-like isoform X2 [Erpetoichthys calabaricus]|uniref:tripartite motif-containing protein 29-like isoform X2 n=1 Tax=Erpetoichthys calabaricus TaxID=27687 RepID=UPI0022348502|nr:tripartite motif-containing protein 29-like isoform X2 [Erpetoichthys calabaricus]
MKEEADAEDSVYCCGCMQKMQEPVYLPCGHGYCTECNKGLRSDTGVSCCSQCKKTLTKRTIKVQTSTTEKGADDAKKRRLSSPLKKDLRPREVMCDFCSGTKCRAVKSCLNCLISYCEMHIQSHFDIPMWRNHKLIDPIENLKMRVCSQHEKPMELYCRTDQTCICCLCEVSEHKTHDTCSTEEERQQKQVPLKANMELIQKALKEKQEKQQAMKETPKLIMASAKREQQECQEIISLLKNLLAELETKLSDLITEHEKKEVRKAKGIKKQLENEIEDLNTRYNEMIKLSETEDHTLFLQNYKTPSVPCGAGASPSKVVCRDFSSEELRKELLDLKTTLEDISKRGLEAVVKTGAVPVITLRVALPCEPLKRQHMSILLPSSFVKKTDLTEAQKPRNLLCRINT